MKQGIKLKKQESYQQIGLFRLLKHIPPVFSIFVQGLLLVLVFVGSPLVSKEVSFSEQCNQEVAKKELNKALIRNICLQAAKQEEVNEKYGSASWYYILGGEFDYILQEMPKHIDPKTSTVIYANIGHAYVLKGNAERAKEMYWKFLILGGKIMRDEKVTLDEYENMKKVSPEGTTIEMLKIGLQLAATNIPINEDYTLLIRLYPLQKENIQRGKEYWKQTIDKFRTQRQSKQTKKLRTTSSQKAVKTVKKPTISIETNGESFSYKGTDNLQDIDNKLSGSGNTYGIKSPENLKVTHDLACKGKENIKNIYTPADLFAVVIRCMKERQYDKAKDYYIIAHVFGYFDQLRVLDKSARVATNALKMETLLTLRNMDLPIEENFKLTLSKMAIIGESQVNKQLGSLLEDWNKQRIQLLKEKDTAERQQRINDIDKVVTLLRALVSKEGMEKAINYRNSLCISLKKIGMPTYYPEYMIQHGLVAAAKKEIKGMGMGNINSKTTMNALTVHAINASVYEIKDFNDQVMDINGNGIIPSVNLKENWKNTFSEFSICK